MYDRILLATDGTAASENAERHAISLAKTHGATVHTLYVVGEDVYGAYSGDEYVDVVLLGTRRRPDEYRNLLGNVTDRVLRLTPRAVVVIKPDVEE